MAIPSLFLQKVLWKCSIPQTKVKSSFMPLRDAGAAFSCKNMQKELEKRSFVTDLKLLLYALFVILGHRHVKKSAIGANAFASVVGCNIGGFMSKHTKKAGVRAEKAAPAGKHGKIIGIVAASLVAVLVVAFAGFSFWLLQGDGICQGVHVGDVDVSGMSRRQALDAVGARYAGSAAQQDLVIKVGDQTFTLSSEECPVSYDVERAVTAACQYGHTGGIFARVFDVWTARQKGACVDVPLSVDDTTLLKQMGAISQAVKVDYRPSGYTYENGELLVDKGNAGRGIDATKLAGVVREHLLNSKTEAVEMALGVEQPLALDWNVLAAVVQCEPKNAYLDLEKDPSGKTIAPAQPGRTLDVTAAKAMVEAAEGPVSVPILTIDPDVTVDSLQASLFRDVLGTATTSLATSSSARTTNVKLAADFCNNTVLLPGEVFSYNETVGPRTEARGFKKASVYVGSTVQEGLGGGICQTSSTLYMATVFADLEIVERRNHSRDVLYTPDGQDATVVWGSTDYRFRNNTEYPIRIVAAVTGSGSKKQITVTIYGTQTTPGKEVKMETEILTWNEAKPKRVLDTSLAPGTEKQSGVWYHGYTCQTYRVTYINGVEVSRVAEAYSKYTRYDNTVTIRYNPAVETPDSDPVVPDSGTTDPGAGGTTDPGTGGITDPGTGGTTDPGTGGTTDPGTGGTTDPGAGGTEDSGSGDAGASE